MAGQAEIQRRLDDIIAKAKGGSADAQYALAVVLSRRDETKPQALEWMNRAIAAGHAGAIFTLGAWYIQGILVSPDHPKGHALLDRAAAMNFEDAIVMRAALIANGIGVSADWPAAFKIILDHARAGGARSLSQLAFLCAMTGEPALKAEGDKLLELAAEAYDGVALYATAQRALAVSAKNEAAEQALHRLALAGKILRHPLAAEDPRIQAIEVKLPLPRHALNLETIAWDKIAEALSPTPPVPKPAQANVVSQDPYIATFPGFLSPEESDALIALANPHLRPSQVTDPITGKYIAIDYRTSHDMRFWHVFQDLTVYCINLRIAKASGEALSHQEMLGVLRYQPGEEYKPHGDFLTPDAQGKNPEVERSGQRIKTFLTYLNDGYAGGETEFVRLGLKVKGAKGEGLMFRNVTDQGAPDERTVHAGLPIARGVKWLSTIWIRGREYRSRD
jgi:prolyl 4-hydroxylase